MMKLIFVFAALVCMASAARVKKPIEEYFTDFAGEEDIHLITGEDDRPPTNFVGDVMKAKTTSIKTKQGTNKFNYNFETQNGISIASIGKLKDEKTFVVSGSYTYTGADGKRYRVRYTADEFGYHPVTSLDDQPEPVIAPAPTPAPLPRPTFAPLPAFQNANRFGNLNNQNSANDFDGYEVSKQYNNGHGINYNKQVNGFGNTHSQNGYNAGNLVNGYSAENSVNGNNAGSLVNGYNAGNSVNGNNAGNLVNGYSAGNSVNGYNNGNSVNGNNAGNLVNGYNAGNSVNGYNNGNPVNGNNAGNLVNGYNAGNSVNGNNAGNSVNGYNAGNSVNGYNAGFDAYDRTGKTLGKNELVFNQNFVRAQTPYELSNPNRLYLPAAPTYLPPVQEYQQYY